MSLGFLVLLKLTVTVAQPAYDFGEPIFEDGTVAFTAVLKNVSRASVRVCTDSLESIRVKTLTVDGEAVMPREDPGNTPNETINVVQNWPAGLKK